MGSTFIAQTIQIGDAGSIAIPGSALAGDLIICFGLARPTGSPNAGNMYDFGPGIWVDFNTNTNNAGDGDPAFTFAVRKIFAGETDLVLTEQGAPVTLIEAVLQVWRGAALLFTGITGDYSDANSYPAGAPTGSGISAVPTPTLSSGAGGVLGFSVMYSIDATTIDGPGPASEGYTNYYDGSNVRVDARGVSDPPPAWPQVSYTFTPDTVNYVGLVIGFSGAPAPASPSASPSSSPSASPSSSPSPSASPSPEPCTPPIGRAISCVNARGRLFVTLANDDLTSQVAFAWHEGAERMPITSMTNWKRSMRALTLQELDAAFETDNADPLNPMIVSVHRNLRKNYVRDARVNAGSDRVDSLTAQFDSDNIGDCIVVFGHNIGGPGINYLLGRIAETASPSSSPSPSASPSASPSVTESASPSLSPSASPSSSRSGSPSPSHSPSASPSASPSRSPSASPSITPSASPSASPSSSPSSSQSASPSAS